MNYPTDRKYHKQHLWVKMDEDTAVVGMSDFAQTSLGGILFITLPQEGETATAGESFGSVESEKAVSELISPVSGTICAVNEDLADMPDDLNLAPYRHWIIKVANPTDNGDLLSAAEYQALCENN